MSSKARGDALERAQRAFERSLERVAAPARAPLANPTPRAWRTQPPSTPYPCGKAEGKRVGTRVPGRRGGPIVGCATPSKSKPREGQYQIDAKGGPATLRKSVVARRLRDAARAEKIVRGDPPEQIEHYAREAERTLDRAHIPGPPGVEFPHARGRVVCAFDHPLWEQVTEAVEAITERLAMQTEGESDEPISREQIAAELAKDPRYPGWVATERKCVQAALERAAQRKLKLGAGSTLREALRARTRFINEGGDVTSAAYFDDVLAPEARKGFFYRQWKKAGGSPNSPWLRLYRLAQEQERLRKPARAKTAPRRAAPAASRRKAA